MTTMRGGLVGCNSGGTISICISNVYGTVEGDALKTKEGGRAGGLVGANTGPINNCSATVFNGGYVASKWNYTGGLVGANGGPINSCSSTIESGGTVESYNSGGLVGIGSANINSSTCVMGGTITGWQCAGGLQGYGYAGVISNCTCNVSGTVYAMQLWAGGLCGYATAMSMTECAANISGNVTCYPGNTGYGMAGGLVADSDSGVITSCTAEVRGTVSGSEYVGGFAGLTRWNSAITNCSARVYGSVISSLYYTGGFIGDSYHDNTFQNCSSDIKPGSTVSGWSNVGGFIGINYSNITGCSSTVESGAVVQATNDYGCGGFAGIATSDDGINGWILNSSSTITGTVSGESLVGGFVGDTNVTITNCFSNIQGGTVEAQGNYSGGFVGNNLNTVNGCYASVQGTVKASSYSGGFVGCNDKGSISDSYVTGCLSSEGSYTGGFIGWDGTGGTITNCYSALKISATSNKGGFLGYTENPNTPTVYTSCYWDQTKNTGLTDYPGGGDLTGVTSKSTGDMEKTSTYIGWNFGDTWDSHNNSQNPTLKWQGIPGDTIKTWALKSGTGLWSNPANWSPAGVPGPADSVKFDTSEASVTIDMAATVENFSILSSYYGAILQQANISIEGSYIQESGLFQCQSPTTYTMTVEGSLVIEGGTFNRFLGGTGTTASPYLICDIIGLQTMNQNLSASYRLATPVDASAASVWNGGIGFEPIGSPEAPFTGNFDGSGEALTSLYINRASQNNIGLFGYTGPSAKISNVNLGFTTIEANKYAGGIAGTNNGTITASRVKVSNSYLTASSGSVGVLAGLNNGKISDCYTTGDATATGNYIGGFIGENAANSVTQLITNCYSAAKINGTLTNNGGFAGTNSNGSFVSCYWNNTLNPSLSSCGSGVGLTGISPESTASMETTLTYTGWNFAETWNMTNNKTYPSLTWEGIAGDLMNRWKGSSGNWSVPTNWSLNHVPTATDEVVFSNSAGTITINTAATVENFFILSSFTGIITQEANLTIEGSYLQKGGTFQCFNPATYAMTVKGATIIQGGVLDRHDGSRGGTPSNAIPISDLAGLQAMQPNLNYQLANDIDASDTANWSDAQGSGFMPIGNPGNPFNGRFDGAGFKITNLYISRESTSDSYIGLFGCTGNTAVIEHVKLNVTTIKGYSYTGALSGFNYGTITGCEVDIVGEISSISNNSGGLVGYDHSGTIEDCTVTVEATGSVVSHNECGGIAGLEDGGTMTNCAANISGEVTAITNNTGGIAGDLISDGQLTDCSATVSGTVSAYSCSGGVVGFCSSSTISNCTGGVQGIISASTTFSGGIAGELIYSSELLSCTAEVTGTVEAKEDYSGGITGYCDDSSDMKYCSSNISGLVKAAQDYSGGIAGFNSGSITNNSIANISGEVTSQTYSGGLVGGNQGLIDTCTSMICPAGTVFVNLGDSGGIAGENDGTIESSTSVISGKVINNLTPPANICPNVSGGIAAINNFEINNCSATIRSGGLVQAYNGNSGGIAGINYMTIESSSITVESNGAISACGAHVGGIAGDTEGPIRYCTSMITGTVMAGDTQSGGIAGYASSLSSIIHCSSTIESGGLILANDGYAGGLVGYNNATIESCSSMVNGIVSVGTGYMMAGGLVGQSGVNSNIEHSSSLISSTGQVNAPYYSSGGFIGQTDGGTITNCTAIISGEVSACVDAGGFAGEHGLGTITNCTAEVYGKILLVNGEQNAGGFVGECQQGQIQGCSVVIESTGIVSGSNWPDVGGFIGQNYGNITGCSSSIESGGIVQTGASCAGGFAGAAQYNYPVFLTNGSIGNSSSIVNGTVMAESYDSGGFAGRVVPSVEITNSSSTIGQTGVVQSNNNTGGFVGDNCGNINDSCVSVEGMVESSVQNSGGFAGHTDSGSLISNSYAAGSMTTGGKYVGGFLGAEGNVGGTIKNCYSAVKLNTTASTGGFSGYTNNTNYVSCYWLKDSGINQGLNDAYSGVDLSGVTCETTASMETVSTYVGWNFASEWEMYQGTRYPTLKWQGLGGSGGTVGNAPIKVWSGMAGDNNWSSQQNWDAGVVPGSTDEVVFDSTASKNATINIPVIVKDIYISPDYTGTITQQANLTVEGSFIQQGGIFQCQHPQTFTMSVEGSFSIPAADNSFVRYTGTSTRSIYDVYGLQAMGQNLSASYQLAGSIDASGTSKWNAGAGFVAVGSSSSPFTGMLDGGGNMISGLYINTNNGNVGLVGYLGQGGTVKNINLSVTTIIGYQNVGGLVGYADTGSSISNDSAVVASVVKAIRPLPTGTPDYLGSAGGLIGYNKGVISSCSTTIESNGNVTVTDYYSGGLVGFNSGTVKFCSISLANGCLVTAAYFSGGLVGWNDTAGKVISCESDVAGMVSSSQCPGGLVGVNNGTISTCYGTVEAAGQVYSWGYGAGGLVGSMSYGSITGCTAEVFGIVKANQQYAGGLTGMSNSGATINNCTSRIYGTVEAFNIGQTLGGEAGGLVGDNNCTINNCSSTIYSHGVVEASPDYAGGFIAVNISSGVVNSCSSTIEPGGMVLGGNNCGGFAGVNFSGTINNSTCVVNGTINGGHVAGGFVGDNWLTGTAAPIISGCVALISGSGTIESSSLTGGLVANVGPTAAVLANITNSYSNRIISLYDLQLMQYNLSGSFELANDIDASDTSGWSDAWGNGFYPIGRDDPMFTGTFEGNNHTISNLYINRPSYGGIGLFGRSSGQINNINLIVNFIEGASNTGALVGLNYGGTLSGDSVKVNGIVNGWQFVGGLVGYSTNNLTTKALITGCSAEVSGTVETRGGYVCGGLVGANYCSSQIISCEATISGSVTSLNNTSSGGLVGENAYGGAVISQCRSILSGTGIINAIGPNSKYSGGLVGVNDATAVIEESSSTISGIVTAGWGVSGGFAGMNTREAVIEKCSSTISGEVIGVGQSAGGFVGWNFADIENCYATGMGEGTVIAPIWAGGFAGPINQDSPIIKNCYTTVGLSPSNSTWEGGFVAIGYDNGSLINCYWYNDGSIAALKDAGNRDSGNGNLSSVTSLNAAQITQEAQYQGFNFGTTWLMRSNTTPFLAWENTGTVWDPGVIQSGGDNAGVDIFVDSGADTIVIPDDTIIGSICVGPGYTGTIILGSNVKFSTDEGYDGSMHIYGGTLDVAGTTEVIIRGSLELGEGVDVVTTTGTIQITGDTIYTAGQNIGNLMIGASPDIVRMLSVLTVDNLTINPNDTLVLNGNNLNVVHNLTISPGALLDASTGSSVITVGGDWHNLGTFNKGNSTVVFTDASQVSTLEGSNIFYNLTCTTEGKNITFEGSSITTIEGVFTLTGTVGNPIVLRSSSSPTQWKINPSGTRDISYVDVEDSYNINATAVSLSHSTDSGHNTGWFGLNVDNISPPSGANTGEVTTTLTGNNFKQGCIPQLRMTGQPIITAEGWTISDPQSITLCTFELSGVQTGAWDVYVVNTLEGTSSSIAGAFTVTAVPPTVAGINPATGANTGEVTTSLTGTNFKTGCMPQLRMTGQPVITAEGWTISNSTSITACTFELSGVQAGTWDVYVVNTLEGTSGSSLDAFTITVVPPTITGINPATGANTGQVTTGLTGTNFKAGCIPQLRMTGQPIITAEDWTINSSTSITACTFELTGTQTGTWDVYVVNTLEGTSGSLAGAFRVTVTPPTVTRISPSSAGNTGEATTVLTGTNFKQGCIPQLRMTGQPVITADAWTINSSTSITGCNFNLGGVQTGAWDVYVVNTLEGTSGSSADAFTVTVAPPILTRISPAIGPNTGEVTTILTGTNFKAGCIPQLRMTGQPIITAEGWTINSSTSITACTFELSGVQIGAWDVYVVNTLEATSGSIATAFTVTAVAPTVSTISLPGSMNTGEVITSLTGTNFKQGCIPQLRMTGQPIITADAWTISSLTSIAACNFNLNGVQIGTWDVYVVNTLEGTSGSLAGAFTVTALAPTVTGINPSSGVNTGSVSITNLTGTNFYSGAAVKLVKTGETTINAVNVVRVSQTQITCTLPITGADAGAWDVVVTNIDNQSGTGPGMFAITLPSPTSCAITPLTGTSVKVTWIWNGSAVTAFHIERSADGSQYTEVGTASATPYTGSGTSSLGINTRYWFRVRAEMNGIYSSYSTSDAKYTLAQVPSAQPFGSATSTSINLNWAANSNPAGTLYYCQNTINSNNSGWISGFAWQDTGLEADSDYTYRVKAKNSDGVETAWADLGTMRTKEALVPQIMSGAGTGMLDGDIISSKPKIVMTVVNASGINVDSFKLYIDGVLAQDGSCEVISSLGTAKAVSVASKSFDLFEESATVATFEYTAKNALSEGTHTLKLSFEDNTGTLYEKEITGLRVLAGGTSTVGQTLVYPNPYDPSKGDARISYSLSTDSDICLYIFDVNGNLVLKNLYMSGFKGGTAGYNEVTWDGKNMFGAMASSDVYLIRIVDRSSNRVIGKTRLLIWKGGI